MPLGRRDLVLCSGTLPRGVSFRERVDAAAAAGFRGISMWGRDYARARSDGHDDAEIRSIIADAGLAVGEVDPVWWWLPGAAETGASIPPKYDEQDVFGYGPDELFRIAEVIGARSVNAVDVFGGDWTIDDAIAALAALCDEGAEHGLIVHVEFLPWSKIPDLATAARLAQAAGRENCGIVVDAWHFNRSGSSLDELRATPGTLVKGVQLNDGPREPEADLVEASLHDRRLPGDGDFDVVGLVAALDAIEADAPYGIEVFSDPLHALGATAAANRAGDAMRQVLASAMTRPFRFGVITSNADTGNEWRERARRVEELGYTTLLMPDHYQPQWAPTIGLTMAAEATSTLKVGTLVFANDYRHPMMLAKEIATLDLATEGRVEVGLGAGWRRIDYDQSGMTYDRPGVRIERMVESLACMRLLWSTSEPVDFSGKHYTLTGAEGTPQPHSAGGPPICIGGGGRRILSIAGQHADIVAINSTLASGALDAEAAASASPAAFDEKIGWVRDAAGDRFADIELQMHCPFVTVTDDGDAMAAGFAPLFGASPDEARDVPFTLIGTIDEICDQLERRRARYGFTYVIVPSDALEAFAPVVERLAGT